jgi:hypothetical protein
MRCSIVHAILGKVVVILSLGAIAPVAAQEMSASPAGARTSWIGTPPPSDCLIEPTVVDTVVDALASPVAESDLKAFPLTIPSEEELPAGIKAKPEDVDAASATIWKSIACLNAGDIPRFTSCFSPQGLGILIFGFYTAAGRPPGPLTEQELAQVESNLTSSFAATPQPVKLEDQSRIDKIRDARLLPDGRILFLVDGTVGENSTIYAVFRLVVDQWLIDAIGQVGETPA